MGETDMLEFSAEVILAFMLTDKLRAQSDVRRRMVMSMF